MSADPERDLLGGQRALSCARWGRGECVKLSWHSSGSTSTAEGEELLQAKPAREQRHGSGRVGVSSATAEAVADLGDRR